MLQVPKPLVWIAMSSLGLALIPPFFVARLRAMNDDKRRIHLIQNMDNQSKFKPQHVNPLFADGRAARPQVDGTVARSQSPADEHYALGWANGAWAQTFPAEIAVDEALLARGRERYDIYCAPCHGLAGYGDGMVHQRAMELLNNPAIGNGTQWVAPKNIHEPAIREEPVGQIYNTVTNGIRTMAGYAAQIPIDDRWAIVAYVKALQRSQFASPSDVPGGRIEALDTIDLRPAAEGEAK